MALVKSSLASDLEQIIEAKPSAAEAPTRWAQAYASYAQNAMSSASSLPTNAMGNMSILVGAFGGAFQTRDSSGAGSAIAAGVMGFWAAIAWVGGAAAGTTIVPGNFSLGGALGSVFADTDGKSASEKAQDLADAFHAGATQVVVMDIPFVQPAPPIVGPVS